MHKQPQFDEYGDLIKEREIFIGKATAIVSAISLVRSYINEHTSAVLYDETGKKLYRLNINIEIIHYAK